MRCNHSQAHKNGSKRVPYGARIGLGVGATVLTAALVSSFAFSGAPATQSFAFVNDNSIEEAVGDTPVIKGTLEHSKSSDGSEPKPGEDFTYTGKFTFNVPEGAPNRIRFSVTQDSQAPFKSAPQLADLKFPSGNVVGVKQDNNDPNTWVYTIENVTQGGTATFVKQATLSAEAGPGTIISGSANFAMTPTGDTQLQNLDQKLIWDAGQCSGVAYFKYRVPEGKLGAWLTDIKFADYSDSQDAVLDPLPANAAALADPKMEKRNGFRVSSPGTTDGAFTNEYLTEAVTRNDDSTKPLFGTDPKLANGRFLDSINWPYNPETWTGKQWIKSGTVFEIRRGFKLANCLPVRVSTSPNPKRDIIGVQISQGRKLPTNDQTAIDVFRLPGGKNIDENSWCDDIYFMDMQPPGTFIYGSPRIGSINIKDPQHGMKTVAFPDRTVQGGIAMGRQYPGWLYYVPQSNMRGLKRFNVQTGRTETVRVTNPRALGYDVTTQPSAFSPDGSFWLARTNDTETRLYRYEFNEDGTVATVYPGAIIMNQTDIRGAYVNDFAFMSNGDFLATFGSSSKAITYVFTAEQVKKNERLYPSQGKKYGTYTNGGYIYGSAFGSDGQLYVSKGTSTATRPNVYIEPESGNRETYMKPFSYSPAAATGILDLTSCSFGGQQPGPTGVKVQKSAVDPVTGTLAPAGEAAKNPVMIGADGTATLKYVVTATNVGDEPITPQNITDTFTAPKGFTVKSVSATVLGGDRLPNVSGSPFTLPVGELAPGGTKAFAITIRVKADSLQAANNATAQVCKNDGNGTPGTGFFNQVAMPEDADGTENNDACIPFTGQPTAHLKLVKQIVNQNGDVINSPVLDDLGHFMLGASGFNPETGSPLAGVSGQAKGNAGVAADEDVVPGNYKLVETIAEPGALNGYYQSGNWDCVGGRMLDGNTVNVPKNGSVTCTIKNTRTPKFHIQKLANTPAEGLNNPHVGEPVVLKNGKGELVYRLEVVNDSNFTGRTGIVRDRFQAPNGLLFDESSVAKVTFSGDGQRFGGKDTYTKAELDQGAVLAESIRGMAPNAKATFTITIPVMADSRQVLGKPVTRFQQHEDALSQCATESATVNRQKVNLAKPNDDAAVNNASLDHENTLYAENDNVWYRDNFACIPVVENKWKVEKFAQYDPAVEGADPANNGGDGFVKTPGSTGTGVVLEPSGEGQLSATVKYRVRVVNRGKLEAVVPEVTDTITLPQGFEITAAKFGRDLDSLAPVKAGGNTVTFTIPASTDKVAGGAHRDYLVEVTGQISATEAAKLNWTESDSAATAAGECLTEGAGRPGTGFFNRVSIDGDDGTDGNNDACTPIKPRTGILLVEKTDAAGARLSGAKFALYQAADASSKPLTMGDLVKADLDPLTAKNAGRFAPDSLSTEDGDDTYHGRFVTPDLNVGTVYFLVETKSPTKDFSLLPEPFVFQVDASGNVVALNAKTAQPIGSADDGTFFTAGAKVSVHDPRTGELPKAGGNGRMPLAVGGTLLVLVSALGMTRILRVRRS
ncbi:SpaA isopeptide-forming pilin-related protein [Boudabousia tangfeifanii]|uniref:SpaA isopeptide-forming pilin-related protein n=1 Tax=Boudabousia tangfeifanii TaxID=1912795 RepID=UPI0012ED18DF|nr:SpaA isopeptide-forming pilin-related protein [Boudabousia tangfeifanii]